MKIQNIKTTSTTYSYKCDLTKCENEAKFINKKFQVIFYTCQTNNKRTAPYLDLITLDMC